MASRGLRGRPRARHHHRLLASPRYGEHWARHWIDPLRYAERFLGLRLRCAKRHDHKYDHIRVNLFYWSTSLIPALRSTPELSISTRKLVLPLVPHWIDPARYADFGAQDYVFWGGCEGYSPA